MLRQILRGHRSNGSSSLLITQYEMPFINKSEATKRSKDRQIYGKCTNGTNRRTRVWPVCFIYSVASQPSFFRSLVLFFSFARPQLPRAWNRRSIKQPPLLGELVKTTTLEEDPPLGGGGGGGGLSPIFELYQQHCIGF